MLAAVQRALPGSEAAEGCDKDAKCRWLEGLQVGFLALMQYNLQGTILKISAKRELILCSSEVDNKL